MDYEPSIPSAGDGAAPSINGGADSGLSSSIHSQLSNPADISAARQFFQPTSAALPNLTTGAESTAMAAKAVAGFPGPMPGAESVAMASAHLSAGAAAGAVAGAAEISPIIQLIMRLPGAMGTTSSFFEWLQNLFLPSSNVLSSFNPMHWAQLGAQIKSSIIGLGQHGLHLSSEHLPISLSLLPGHAPIFHQLGIHGLPDMHSIEGLKSGISSGGTTSFSFRDSLNVSGPLDLHKPQFEMGTQSSHASSSMRLDGALSGPSLNGNLTPSQLAGTERIFSDKVAHAQNLSSGSTSIVSGTNVPVGSAAANSHLNVASSAFGQETGALPSSYQLNDGMVSGPSMSGNVGYQLSGAGSASLDSAPTLSPSGAVSDHLGSQQLLSENVGAPTYHPSMSGYYKPSEPLSLGDSATSGSGTIEPLKAEALSLLKKAKPTISAPTHAKPVMDYQGHQVKGEHHSVASSSSNNVMDQVAHRGSHHSASHASASHAAPSHSPAKSTPAVDRVQTRVNAAQTQDSSNVQYENQPAQTEQAPESIAESQAPTDSVNDYTVRSGDNLWDIAKKNLGDGSRWTEIYKLNSETIGSNPDLIHPGLDLKLPGSDIAQSGGDAANYTVQHGDNLWDIAHKNLGDGGRWGEIYKANIGTIGDNPRLIFAGQNLQMPGSAPVIGQAPAVDPSALGGAAAPQPMAMAQPSAPAAPAAQAPQQISELPRMNDMQVGAGAASAATIEPESPIVSSSLAPDLSFLYTNGNK